MQVIIRNYASALAAVILTLPTLGGATLGFDLIPDNGQIAGPPGSTVGWGYSITNQSATEWLVTSALNADAFFFGSPNAIFDFSIIAPGQTSTVPFDEFSGTGLYEFTWDLDVPDEYTNFGRFTLSAEWWNGDPFNGGSFVQLAPDVTQRYSVAVSETSVPEPGTRSLLVAASVLFVVMRQRYRPRFRPDGKPLT